MHDRRITADQDEVSLRQIKANQGKSRQIKANQGKSRQIKANQGKSRQIKANQGKSRLIKGSAVRTSRSTTGVARHLSLVPLGVLGGLARQRR
jgi:hypothetical protein